MEGIVGIAGTNRPDNYTARALGIVVDALRQSHVDPPGGYGSQRCPALGDHHVVSPCKGATSRECRSRWLALLQPQAKQPGSQYITCMPAPSSLRSQEHRIPPALLLEGIFPVLQRLS
jgi:hypothetical protein